MLKLSIGFLLSFSALSVMAESSQRFHPKHLFVKMKEGESLVKSPLIKDAKKVVGNIYLLKTDSIEALSSELSAEASVEYTQKDYYAGASAMPKHEKLESSAAMFVNKMFDMTFASFNDPHASKLWAFEDKFGMSVTSAYDSLPSVTPKQIIVAVVDTGVDHDHEDLKDIMWTNGKEILGNGKDDDNNGYIDDVHGINTLVRDASGKATMNTQASHWHGTHVAGTIAATQNNGLGITGVANNVKIMALRTVPDNADELDSDIVEAFSYAAKNGAKIINCSFGKATNEGGMIVRDVINEIGRKYGVLVIASAGNDSNGPLIWHNNDTSPKYPAAFDSANLLVIASTTNTGALSNFSNIGPKTVDIASPGSNIFSTMPGNKYGMASGTSMAAPNASGVAAMVLGYYPTLKSANLKRALMVGVTKVPAFESKMTSGGRINLKTSLEKLKK